MCHVIDSDLLLANLLRFRQDPISISELKAICGKVESQIPSLFLDISMDSLCFAVEHRPELFCWTGEAVTRAKDADAFFSGQLIENSMNWRIPASVKEPFLSVLRAA